MITIFLRVLNLGLLVTIPIAVILLLRPLVKKAPAWIACLLWVVVAVRLICPFTLESTFSLMPKTEPVAVLLPSTVPTAAPTEDLPTATLPVPTAVPEGPTRAPDADRTAVPEDPTAEPLIPTPKPEDIPTRAPEDPASLKTPNTSAAPEKTENPPVVPGTEEDPTEPKPILLPVLCGVWVAGMVGMAVYALASSLKIKRRVATATKLENRVKQSENVDSPFLRGLFRPTIYLPYTITDEDKAMALAHERAHVARLDHWWKPLGFLLLTVYWFQPLLWLSYFLLCRDIEAACDEKVVRPMDADARRAYSSALLRYGTRPRTMAVCPLAFGETNIKERVKKVMNFKKPALWIIVISLVLCVILSACFLTDPVKKEDTPSPTPAESSPTPEPTPAESSPTPEPTPSPTPAESNPTPILLTEKGLITAQSDVPNYDADPVDAIRYQGTTKDRSGNPIIASDNWLVNSNWFKDPRNAERVFPTVQFEEELSFTFRYAGVSIVPTPAGGVGFGGTRLYNERYEEIAVLTDLRWLDDLNMEFTYGELKTLSDGTYYLSIPVHYTCITPGNTQLVDDCDSFLIFCLIKTSTPSPTPAESSPTPNGPTPTPGPTPGKRELPDWFTEKAKTKDNVLLNYDLRPHTDFASDDEYVAYLYAFFDDFLAKTLTKIEKSDSFGINVSLDRYYDDEYVNTYDEAHFVVKDPTFVAEYKDICKNLRFEYVPAEQLKAYIAYYEENAAHLVGGGANSIFSVSLNDDGTYYPFLRPGYIANKGDPFYQKVLAADDAGIVQVLSMVNDDALYRRLTDLSERITVRVQENLHWFIADGTVDVTIRSETASETTPVLLTDKAMITAYSDARSYDHADAIRYQGTTKDRSGKSIIEFDNWLVNSNWFKDPRNAERVFPTVWFGEELSFTFRYAGVSIFPTPAGGVGFGGTRLYNERYEEIAVLTDLRWLDDLDMEFTYGELKTLSDGTYYLSIPVHYTCITPGNTQLVDDCNSFLIFCLIKTSTPTPTP